MAGRPRSRITIDTACGDDRWRLPQLSVAEVLALPPSVDLVYAARAVGIGRSAAYQQAAAGGLDYGEDQVPVQRVAGSWRVRRADLIRVLGITETASA